MKDRLEQRLIELKENYNKGEQVILVRNAAQNEVNRLRRELTNALAELEQLDAPMPKLQTDMQRISGAIQVLEEELEIEANGA